MQHAQNSRTLPFVPSYYDDLDGSLDHAWTMLARGVRDRRSPFHTPTLATIDADGAPEARTIVLRGAMRETATLRFHTDRRSHKPVQLERDPRCSVHVYDHAAKIQLRLRGAARLHGEGHVADAAWTGSKTRSLDCYAQTAAPGTVLRALDELEADDPLDLAAARGNFAVILVDVREMEWLFLSHLGHRRALWTRGAGGWTGSWLAP